LQSVHPASTQNVSFAHDLLFFKQTFIGGLIIVTSSLVFNLGQIYLEHKWALFAVTTVAWMTVHVLDGFVVIIFNRHCLLKSGSASQISNQFPRSDHRTRNVSTFTAASKIINIINGSAQRRISLKLLLRLAITAVLILIKYADNG
uniref:7TM_GPCR_Srx domain-containing protein n=1 Tax=Thelazia callipaeda TaxID=103827 RepID=A0A0N5CYH3_THECL